MQISLVAGLAVLPVHAQVVDNPSDPTLASIPYARVALIHAADPALRGGTAWLRAKDPFLLYQFGRDLTLRKYDLATDGAYGQTGRRDVPLYVDAELATAPGRFSRGHVASCTNCHSMPPADAGAGQTIPSTGPRGRNTPHFYGAGLVEMLGLQTRQLILERFGAGERGWLTKEVARRSGPVLITPAPGEPPIDYGTLAPDAHGVPQLNPIFRIWYVDASGRPIPAARSLDDPVVAGLDLVMQPFGWGRGRAVLPGGRIVAEGGEAQTTRQFAAVAAQNHMGLQAFDPVEISPQGVIAGVSLNGARQFDFAELRDRGLRRDPASGASLDDPDADGHSSELSAGDLDAIEFYMLHVPAPMVRQGSLNRLGRETLRQIGCTNCHVENWHIEGRDSARGLPGDRRLFRLEPPSIDNAGGILRLVRSQRRPGEAAGGEYLVRGVYSDFKQWDIGQAFYEVRFDGTVQTEHRTAPLWGVGSTAPYGHDGHFMDLSSVIDAHGGAATGAHNRFAALEPAARAALLAYLANLVLYETTAVPADIDDDGIAAPRFEIAGIDVGYERFDARFLFTRPPRFTWLFDGLDANGRRKPLLFLSNIEESYRLRAISAAKPTPSR